MSLLYKEEPLLYKGAVVKASDYKMGDYEFQQCLKHKAGWVTLGQSFSHSPRKKAKILPRKLQELFQAVS